VQSANDASRPRRCASSCFSQQTTSLPGIREIPTQFLTGMEVGNFRPRNLRVIE